MVRVINEGGHNFIEVVHQGKTLREMYNDRSSISDAASLVSNIISKL